MKTIAISLINHSVLDKWRRALKIKTFDGLIGEWVRTVNEKQKREFYLSLEKPVVIVKPLSGKRIKKIYKKSSVIQ